MRSVRVVFPESMWALMPIFRMREMSWAMRRGKLPRPDQARQPFEILSFLVGQTSGKGGLVFGTADRAPPPHAGCTELPVARLLGDGARPSVGPCGPDGAAIRERRLRPEGWEERSAVSLFPRLKPRRDGHGQPALARRGGRSLPPLPPGFVRKDCLRNI